MSEMTTRQEAKALYKGLEDLVEALSGVNTSGLPGAVDRLNVAFAEAVVLTEALAEEYDDAA